VGIEIERKFLVRDPSVVEGRVGTPFRQGYLSRTPERTVRVRHAGDRAWLTIKGRAVGATRPEWEYEIPPADAEGLLALVDGPILEKTRYLVACDGRTWEIDVFAGANAGLVLAEIELDREDEVIDLPPWLGQEVTDDRRFASSSLAMRPMPGGIPSPVPVMISGELAVPTGGRRGDG
jgi:adenylate cyclase